MSTLIHERLSKLRHNGSSHQPTPPAPAATGEHPHPGRVFLRLLWKEYRQLRALWLVLAAIIAGIVGLMYMVVIPPSQVISWNLILLLPVLFSLAAGAMSFANEKEQGTDRWLLQWAVPPLALFLAKYLVALMGTVALAGVAWALAYIFNIPRDIPFDSPAAYFAVVATALLSSYILSAFVSILTGKILLSAGIGTVVVLYLIYVTDSAFYYSPMIAESTQWIHLSIVVSVIGLGFVITPILFCFRLAGKWPVFESRSMSADGDLVTQEFRLVIAPRTMTRAFLWKEWRQSWVWILGSVLLSVYLFLCIKYKSFGNDFLRLPVDLLFEAFSPSFRHSTAIVPIEEYLFLLFMFVAYLLGLTTYSSEQRDRSFRFLTNHGSSPMSIWLLKQVVWLPFLLIWGGMILWARWGLRSVQWEAIALWTAFAIAQLFSLLIPQRIMSLIIAVVAGSFILVYSLFMQRLGIPILLLDIPLLVAMFLSSFLITRGWMEEWSGWKSVLWKAGILVGPIFAAFTACSLYRANEIPVLAEAETLKRELPPPTPGQFETAKAYASILSKVKPAYLEYDPRFAEMSEQEYAREVRHLRRKRLWEWNRELVKPLVETTKRPEGLFTQFATPGYWSSNAGYMGHQEFHDASEILLGSADAHETAGEWDQAKDDYLAIFGLTKHVISRAVGGMHYSCRAAHLEAWAGLLRWAKQPESTSAQIKSVIDQLKYLAVFPPELLRENYLANYRLDALRQYTGPFNPAEKLGGIYFSTPWEKERARRLIEYARVKHLTDLDRRKAEPKRTMEDRFQPNEIETQFSDLTWLEATTPTNIGTPPYDMAMGIENVARYHLASLAIVAWKKEHGRLPPDGDTAFREYLGAVPVNSWGEKFEFVPIGEDGLFLVRPGY